MEECFVYTRSLVPVVSPQTDPVKFAVTHSVKPMEIHAELGGRMYVIEPGLPLLPPET